MYMQSDLMKSLFTWEIQSFLKEGVRIREQDLGTLKLPTGKIVANDPCCFFEKEPFARTVTPGEYPVRIFVWEHNTDKRVAFAAVRFSGQQPERFEPALLDGQSVDELDEDEFYGYGVDSGTGGFMDASICPVFDKLIDESSNYSYEPLDDALNETYVYTYSTANIPIPGSEGNITAFSTGWGDGSYPSYWGFDKDDNVCCLVTDFCIIGNE